MAHHHQHEGDSYYLDQLCLIALSGAFSAVCLVLYFWQRNMLKLMVGEQFHPFVLGSGIALLVLVLCRSLALWVAVGRSSAVGNGPMHDHEHDHGHDNYCHEHHHHHEHDHDHG